MYLYKKQRQNDKQTNSRNVSSMVSKVEKEGKKVLQKCTISACVPSTHSEYPQIQMEHYIFYLLHSWQQAANFSRTDYAPPNSKGSYRARLYHSNRAFPLA